MAYNSNDVQQLVDIIKPDSPVDIRITKILDTEGNLKSIDIRQYYTDKAGEKAPTQKGVRIGSEYLTQLLTTLLDSVDIETLLDIDSKRVSVEIKDND